MRTTAIDIEAVGFDDNTGYGLIDAYELVTGAEGSIASAPAAPAVVTAVAGNGRATVSWTAAAANGSPVTGYRVTASPGGAFTTTSGATTATVTGLTNGMAYTFTVVASNQRGPGPASTPNAAVTPNDPVERYVARVYGDLLNRPPDSGGLADWGRALNGGVPYEQVAITSSPEFRSGLINGSYQRYLGRSSDASGLHSWLTAMGSGLHIEQMEAGFIASPEFYTKAGGNDRLWVAELYRKVLGRTAATSDVDHWQQADGGDALTSIGPCLRQILPAGTVVTSVAMRCDLYSLEDGAGLGSQLIVVPPEGTARLQLIGASGAVLDTRRFDGPVWVGPAPDGLGSVAALDADGQMLAEIPVGTVHPLTD